MHKTNKNIYFLFEFSSIFHLNLGQLARLDAIAVRVVVPVLRGAVEEHILVGTNAVHHGQRRAFGLHGGTTTLDKLHQFLLLLGALDIGSIECQQ